MISTSMITPKILNSYARKTALLKKLKRKLQKIGNKLQKKLKTILLKLQANF